MCIRVVSSAEVYDLSLFCQYQFWLGFWFIWWFLVDGLEIANPIWQHMLSTQTICHMKAETQRSPMV